MNTAGSAGIRMKTAGSAGIRMKTAGSAGGIDHIALPCARR